jgi:hypothetical protein
MTMTIIKTVGLVALLLTATLAGQPKDEYTPSDPARVGATGNPQLVEFYHPL